MRKRFIVVFVVINIFIYIYLQYGRNINVNTSVSNISDNFYMQELTVTANKLFILDKRKFSEEIIEHCRNNTFHDIHFSYDLSGYPNQLRIFVYTNSQSLKKGNLNFIIKYTSPAGFNDIYNIKDNPEKYILELETN